MAINDRRNAATMTHRRNFLIRDHQPDRRARGGQGGSVDADRRLEANVLIPATWAWGLFSPAALTNSSALI